MTEKFEIIGLKEVEQAISELPIKLQVQIYRSLNRKAVKKYVVDNLRKVLNYSSKTERGIQVVNDRSDRTAVFGGISSDSFVLRFADLGTASRYTEKGAFRGAITGKNQIQPIIEGSVEDIIKYMNEEVGNEIVNILEKRIKSTNKQIAKL